MTSAKYDCRSKQQSIYTLATNPESIHEWARTLKVTYQGRTIVIACELKKGR